MHMKGRRSQDWLSPTRTTSHMFFKICFIFIFYMDECFACMYGKCITEVPGILGGQKMVSGPLELGFEKM